MSVRLYKSFKLAPGVRFHITGRGIGLSVGRRGLHVGIGTNRRPYVSGSIPGTGLSARQYLDSSARSRGAQGGSGFATAVVLIIGAIIALVLILGAFAR